MIIDSHVHVMLPENRLLDMMDEAGIDKAIVFQTSVHPEMSADLSSLEQEMQSLNNILSGNAPLAGIQQKALFEEQKYVINNPDRFIGFGKPSLDMSAEQTAEWIQKWVIDPGFKGMGEFTPASGQVSSLDVIFRVSAEFGNLPLWIHTFEPLKMSDILDIGDLSLRYPAVPIILGHLGGVNWMKTIGMARCNPRLYLDLSGCFSIMAPAMAIRELPERTLFSSDAPYGDPMTIRFMVERITGDPGIRRLVMGENIARLLELKA